MNNPTSTPSTGGLGLRELKRRNTRIAIEEHASRLVALHGFGSVTVEDICKQAEISKRTFFNYFASKEQAVLGKTPRMPSEEQKAAILEKEHDDILGVLLDISIENMTSGHDLDANQRGDLIRRRKFIRRNNPELEFQVNRLFAQYLSELATVAESYFTAFPSARVLQDSTSCRDEAEVLALTITSAIRAGFSRWLNSSTSSFDQLIDDCHHSLNTMQLFLHQHNEHINLSTGRSA